MDDADAFSFFYEREGEAVLFFLARRTMDAEVGRFDGRDVRRGLALVGDVAVSRS